MRPGAVPAILSGPSFAADVARGLPTAVTLAASEENSLASLRRRSARPRFGPTIRPMFAASNRRSGKERACHAAGVVVGRGMGASARRLDHSRLADSFASEELMARRRRRMIGLSGLGDLSDLLEPAVAQFHLWRQSRPRRKADQKDGGLAEGVFTASVLLDMARERDIDMPIASAVVALPRRQDDGG